MFFPYSMVADKILFNSDFNKESLLKNISRYLNIMPDYKPKNLEEKIRPKCEVLSFPIDIPEMCVNSENPFSKKDTQSEDSEFASTNKKLKGMDQKLHIVWPHRWFVCFVLYNIIFKCFNYLLISYEL